MILRQPLVMCLYGPSDFFGVLHGQKVANDLAVVFGLPREAEGGVRFFQYLAVGHDLDDLERVGDRLNSPGRNGRNLTVHQRRLRMKSVEKRGFKWRYVWHCLHGIRPHPRDFPNINLAVCDDI